MLEIFAYQGHNGKCVLASEEWVGLGDLYNQVYRRTDLPIAEGMVRVVFELDRSLPKTQDLYISTEMIKEAVRELEGALISDRRADIPKAEITPYPGLELTYSYLNNLVLLPEGIISRINAKHAATPGSETNACPRDPRKILVKILWDCCD